MKKTWMLFGILLLLLPSCKTDRHKPPLSPDFSSGGTFTATVEGFQTSGIWRGTEPNRWELSFQAPESISGLRYCCVGDRITIRFHGAEQSVCLSGLPPEGIPRIFLECICRYTLNAPPEPPSKTETGWRFAGTVSAGNFQLDTDFAGNPQRFRLSGSETELLFFRAKDEAGPEDSAPEKPQ